VASAGLRVAHPTESPVYEGQGQPSLRLNRARFDLQRMLKQADSLGIIVTCIPPV
jgi:hypothetical protein